MQEIDWKRVAAPQRDQYDSEVVLRLAREGGYKPFDVSDLPTCGDGAIALRHDGTLLTGCDPAPFDHPNIEAGIDLIRLWPEVYLQCQALLDYISPFVKPDWPDNIYGSICGTAMNGFGSIATTVNSRIGFAEAVVHEMGHHKLRGIGIDVEAAERLIVNAPDRLYRSPIRYDSERPMTAVIHAQYSYTYIAALDLAIIDSALDPERDRHIAENSLAVIMPKLKFGRAEIERHAEVDDDGAAFLQGFFDWIDSVVSRSEAVLESFGIAPVPFEHPLDRDPASKQTVTAPAAEQPTVEVAGPESIEACWSGLKLVPRQKPKIEAHGIRDELVLYCPDREAAFALNATSRSIWELCDGAHTMGEMSRSLLTPLDCDDFALLHQLTMEIVTTLQDFHGNGLIDVSDPAAARPG